MDNIFIKVCGLTKPENIFKLDRLDVDYLGFIFYAPSKRNALDLETPLETKAKKIGVFVNEDLDFIMAQVQKHQLSGVQLHGEESPALCQQLKNKGLIVWKVFGIDSHFVFDRLEAYLLVVDAFLFDTKSPQKGGTGKHFDWKLLNSYPFEKPIILSGGIELKDVEAIASLNLPHLIGLDINSKFEIKPGVKEVEKVKAFITAIKSDA